MLAARFLQIVAPARDNAVLVGLLAGLGQRHVLRRAEPDIPVPAIDHQALHPGPRSGALHEQLQRVPVRVASRRGQSREPLDRQSGSAKTKMALAPTGRCFSGVSCCGIWLVQLAPPVPTGTARYCLPPAA